MIWRDVCKYVSENGKFVDLLGADKALYEIGEYLVTIDLSAVDERDLIVSIVTKSGETVYISETAAKGLTLIGMFNEKMKKELLEVMDLTDKDLNYLSSEERLKEFLKEVKS